MRSETGDQGLGRVELLEWRKREIDFWVKWREEENTEILKKDDKNDDDDKTVGPLLRG